jgi:hypothetical protein
LDVLPAAADESSGDVQPGNNNMPIHDDVGENSAEEGAIDVENVNTNLSGQTTVEGSASDHINDQITEGLS